MLQDKSDRCIVLTLDMTDGYSREKNRLAFDCSKVRHKLSEYFAHNSTLSSIQCVKQRRKKKRKKEK